MVRSQNGRLADFRVPDSEKNRDTLNKERFVEQLEVDNPKH